MNGFREKFDKLNDKIYHTLNIDGKTGEIIETMNYNIKKGLVKGTDLLGEHLVESGLLSQNPFITGIGVFVNSNKDGFRDVIMEKNNIEYLDKKIKEECRNRPHRNEYKSMSPDEKKIDDALWRRKRWMEEGLDSKRKLLGYDRMIEWALEECKKKEVLRAKFDRKIDIDEKQFDMFKQTNSPNKTDAKQYQDFKSGKYTFRNFLEENFGKEAKKVALRAAKAQVKKRIPNVLSNDLGLSK